MFKKLLSSALSLMIALNFLVSPLKTSAATYFFKDINGHWGAQDIEQLRTKCGINGYKDKNGNLTYLFKPDSLITRAEIVMMLAQCHKLSLGTLSSNPFPDLNKSHWGASAVSRGKTLGWLSGYPDGLFRPNDHVNRAEAVKMIVSSFYSQATVNKTVINQIKFYDVPTDAWFAIFVYFSSERNLVQGYKDAAGNLTHKFGPEKNMTRAEAAKVIVRAMNDSKTVSPNNTNNTTNNTTNNDTTNNQNTTTDPNQNNQQTNQPAPGPITPTTSHPRLWLTSNDLPRLRSWAVASNPVYQQGLLPIATKAKKDMDDGKISKDQGSYMGSSGSDAYYHEVYSMLFAYMSLIENDQKVRDDYAQRARKLLMEVMNEAVKGQQDGQPYRHKKFAVGDRAHFYGEAWGLTVDWIYPYLTAEDKATIKKVFLRWGEEISNSTVTGAYAHPTPVGTVNDPTLLHLDDPNKFALRFASNNHFTFHMRNMGLMMMSLDSSDDTDGQMAMYLKRVTGAWLYMFDYLLRNELSKGGNGSWTEGKQYTPSGMGAAIHLYLAFKTAGTDPNVYGKQVLLGDNPYWSNVIPAYLHALSPATKTLFNFEWLGPSYEIASYGDADKTVEENSTKIFGALGLYYYYANNQKALNDARWIEVNAAPGGASKKVQRIGNSFSSNGSARNAILSFMLFDPAASEPTDPRPALPLTYFGEGINRLLARTSWDSNATWITYYLNWNRIDHQHGEGNMIEMYRKGEYLTKDWVGYGPRASSDFNNTLALQNDPPKYNSPGSYQNIQWTHGAQWQYIGAGDPKLLAKSFTNDYIYITGDATNLYNSTMDNATDIIEASRSFVWLKPDHMVIYDRAESKTANRFKRFWLNLASQPTIETIAEGIRSVMTTANGQKFYITTLLPQNASVTSTNERQMGSWGDESAAGETMNYRLKVEATGGPQKTRFLHVLQGADSGVSASSTNLVQSTTANLEGAVVDSTAIMFSVSSTSNPTSATYFVPATVSKQIITGLKPNTGYTITTSSENNQLKVEVSEGGSQTTDAGGVLVHQ